MRLEYFWSTATLILDPLLPYSYVTTFVGRCDSLETDIPSTIRVFPTTVWDPNIYYRLHR